MILNESEWLNLINYQEYQHARKFSNAFCFIDDLIIINGSDELLNSTKKSILRSYIEKENNHEKEATFLDLPINIDTRGKINTKLYDKINSYNFFIVRFPHKSSNLQNKMFYSTISAETLRICRATTDFNEFILTSKLLIQWMLR